MIIQVRGTSGSGKSTVVRKTIGDLSLWTPEYADGRKKPLYYQRDGVALLGHYESPCGGGDTIGSARAIFDLIQEVKAKIVLVEGLLLSEDVKWSSQLKDLRVLFLMTPVEQCLEWICKRRESVGNDKPLNPYNTTNRVQVIERARIRLTGLGVYCRRASANQASKIIQQWIGEN